MSWQLDSGETWRHLLRPCAWACGTVMLAGGWRLPCRRATARAIIGIHALRVRGPPPLPRQRQPDQSVGGDQAWRRLAYAGQQAIHAAAEGVQPVTDCLQSGPGLRPAPGCCSGASPLGGGRP
ncbi:hypothetical protein ACKKBF_B16045 [Auxenochlorella protothecoides x Auxenochlorella symbiontica]